MERKRSNICGEVAGVPVVNSYFSGDLTEMTDEQLRRRLEELSAVDPDDLDCDEAFDNRMNEISAINAELESRKKEEQG